jgi:hypothetical protein
VAAAGQEPSDPAAAERQYRVAERLSADRSPDAAAAFAKVVALAPQGPLADDALVDLARFHGAPDWPEDLGAVDAARAALIRAPLEKVVDAYPRSDRAVEARYRLALLRAAPLAGRDPVRAREDLIAIAAGSAPSRWTAAARYALGILDERDGAGERAAGAFARIVIEGRGGDASVRARAGLGRSLLASGAFGSAAVWLQQAADAGAPAILRAAEERDLAVAEIERARNPERRWSGSGLTLMTAGTTRGASLLTTARDGGIVVYDRKLAALEAIDVKGTIAGSWAVPDATALATDPYGRVFVATKDKLQRLDASGLQLVVPLTTFGAPAAIAVDAGGSVWVADRRGDRIARWEPGSQTPVVVRERKGAGIAALVVSGRRVVAAEEKTGRIVVVDPGGTESDFGRMPFKRPIALAADPAGRISVLDEKADTLTRLSAGGEVADTLALGPHGVSRPLALAVALDGAVRVLDGASGAVAVVP